MRVDEAAAYLGFDAHATLVVPLREDGQRVYSEYRWVVIPHWLAKDGPVIYALPPMHRADIWPWESWYRDGAGALIHHVHYAAPHPRCTATWRESPGAPQRPPEIFGVTWHWYDEPTMTPALGGRTP